MLCVVTEVFSHGAPSVWGQELQWSTVRRCGGDDDAVAESILLFQGSLDLSDGGPFLANSNVKAIQGFAFVTGIVQSSLVDHAVNGYGGLTGLTVANDQFPLATSDRNKTVNSFQASLYWFVHGLTCQDTWCFNFYTLAAGCVDWAFAIDWFAKAINNAA